MTRLDTDEIRSRLGELAGWQRQDDELTKTFTFSDFAAAISFVDAVAVLAEAAQHHPDVDIRWNEVRLGISTHSEGGITEADFALAYSINSMI